jgi:hypothetical protein
MKSTSLNHAFLISLCAFLFLGTAACRTGGMAVNNTVRVATATPEQLDSVKDMENVWYEFQPGDIIPVNLIFFGALEGGVEGSAGFRAKKHFYFVMSKNGPMRVSFDGKTFAGPMSTQTVIAVVPNKNAPGGKLGWLIYVGESGQPEQELKAIIDSQKGAAPPAAGGQ